MSDEKHPIGHSQCVPPSPARIKRKADSIRIGNSALLHLDALDEACRSHGWPSYKAYLRAWTTHRASARSKSHFQVTFIAHWRDARTDGTGKEVAYVTLSEPWWAFLSLEQRRSVPAVSRFRIAGRDRSKLISTSPFDSAISARNYAQKAARILAFVDVLRVVPAPWTKVADNLGIDRENWRFPAKDHELPWQDPKTGSYFLTNEPYADSLARKLTAQESWRSVLGVEVLTLPDVSMHNMPYTVLQFISKRRQPVAVGLLTQAFSTIR